MEDQHLSQLSNRSVTTSHDQNGSFNHAERCPNLGGGLRDSFAQLLDAHVTNTLQRARLTQYTTVPRPRTQAMPTPEELCEFITSKS